MTRENVIKAIVHLRYGASAARDGPFVVKPDGKTGRTRAHQ
jgi:hypothetical protein